jgi:hypothetical protein
MPQCSRCSREMSVVSRTVLTELGGTPGGRYHAAKGMRNLGHPLLSLAVSVAGGIATAANHLFEKVQYRCFFCDTTTTQISRRK